MFGLQTISGLWKRARRTKSKINSNAAGEGWTGEELNSITDAVTSANSETFTYTPRHRLASAKGAYGSLAWTYDAVGNRATQVVGAATQTTVTPTTSNQLGSITQTGATTRSWLRRSWQSVHRHHRIGRSEGPIRRPRPSHDVPERGDDARNLRL